MVSEHHLRPCHDGGEPAGFRHQRVFDCELRATVSFPHALQQHRMTMKRRDLLGLLGGLALSRPLAVKAEESGKVWRMGFLAQGYEKFYDALFDGLRQLGYQEGRNLLVERRYAEGRSERFREFAAEMVQLNVDVIVVSTTPAGFAVKSPRPTSPWCFPTPSVRSKVVWSRASPIPAAT